MLLRLRFSTFLEFIRLGEWLEIKLCTSALGLCWWRKYIGRKRT